MSFHRVDLKSESIDAKIERMKDKAETLKQQYKKDKFIKQFKERVKHSKKIEDYIPKNWDHARKKLHDIIIELNNSIEAYGNNNSVFDAAVIKHCTKMLDTNDNILDCCYAIVEINGKAAILIIYGETEQKAFIKVMQRKAKYFKNVPQVIDGRIVGKVSLSEIMKLFHSYDVHYALYLNDLYLAGKIQSDVLLST